MKRCDKTDLPVDMCGDTCCRPDLAEQPVEKVRVTTQFEARYDSRCDLCDAQIKAGDQMGYGAEDARVCKRHL